MSNKRRGTMAFNVLFLHLLIILVESSTNVAIYTNLMRKYFLLCGPDYFCNSSNDSHRFNVSLKLSYRQIQLCPDCQCDKDCVLRGDCCPDLYFQFPEMKCVNRTIINGMFDMNRNLQTSALMVTTCPYNSKSEIEDKCLLLNDTKSRLLHFPVTGSTIPLTFYNKYCAECNNVKNYTTWSLDIGCQYTTDFNYLSSLDEIVVTATSNQCVLQAYRNIPDKEEGKEENCFDVTEGSLISRCNVTGEWKNFDEDIAKACESFYKVKFRVFKNVFCYMCNPSGQQYMTETYESCNETGMWFRHDSGLERACDELPQSNDTIPFKNIFCYLCNNGNPQPKRFVDIFGEISESPVYAYAGDAYFSYQYVIDEIWLDLKYFKDVVLKDIDIEKENDFYLQPFRISSFNNKNGDLINLTSLLLYEASLHHGVNVCKSRESLLPFKDSNECACDFFCLFGHGINCCADIAVELPTTCLNSLNLSLTYLTVPSNDGYLTIDGCFQEKRSKLLDQRCSFPETDDIFSVLPLSKGQTNFANIYCAICNIESDQYVEKLNSYTNASYEYQSIHPNLSLQHPNPTLRQFVDDFIPKSIFYETWGLQFLCPKHLDYSHLPTAGYLIKLAKQIKCRIEYSAKTGESKSCSPYKYISKDRCVPHGSWTYPNPDIDWACHNVRAKGLWFAPTMTTFSPFKIEMPQSGLIYSNIFCALCIPSMNFTENFVDNCTKDDIKECFELPTIYIFFPFKNVHCLNCNGIFPLYGSIHHGDTGDRDRKHIKPIVGDTWFPILRNMFFISGTDNLRRRIGEEGDHCEEYQVYDYKKNECRNITCYDGKNLVNTRCLPLLQITKNLRFSLSFKMGIFTKKQSKQLVSLPASEQILKENLRSVLDLGATDIELITDKEEIIESDGKEFDYALCRFVHFDIFIRSSTPRLYIEESLINFKNQLVDGCILSEYPQVLISPRSSTDGAPGNEKILRGKSLVNAIDFFIAKVSKVLTCTQIELFEDEYNISNDNLSIFLHGIDRNVPFDEFAKSTTGHIRICLEYLKESQYFLRPYEQSNEAEKYFKYLWIMSLVCSIISIISLALTLTLYFLLTQLRTTSGKLLILMMVSLLLTMLFMQLSYFTIQMPDGCVISAAMLHFSWLSVFTSMCASNFLMFYTFTSSACQRQNSNRFIDKTVLKYSIFVYGLPIFLVILNGSLAWFIYVDDRLGYGGSKCFIRQKSLTIATFICPVALICFVNILFLISTIRAIYLTPNPENNKRKRNEIAIYFRLTAITGVSWTLQIIDSFLPVTIFTFVATFINSLQGFFVLLALITNQRIWNLICNRICTKKQENASTTQTLNNETDMSRL